MSSELNADTARALAERTREEWLVAIAFSQLLYDSQARIQRAYFASASLRRLHFLDLCHDSKSSGAT